MYEHNALGYWSGLALCLTKVRSSRARCPATALICLCRTFWKPYCCFSHVTARFCPMLSSYYNIDDTVLWCPSPMCIHIVLFKAILQSAGLSGSHRNQWFCVYQRIFSLHNLSTFQLPFSKVFSCFFCFMRAILFCFGNYTPGIYADGYIVFAFPFVRSYVRLFVRSFVR